MIKTMLFDLDGTIVDTNELIIQTFLHVLKGHVPPDFSREQIIPHMGTPLDYQMRLFTGRDDVAEFTAAYRSYNRDKHDELVKEFPHVKEVIERLHRHGVRMGVVTTKIRETTERALKMFGLAPYMDTLVTIDDVKHPKPHPEPVLIAMEQLGADPATTMMVGDSPADIQSGNAAGAVSVAVAWSLKGEDALRQFEPKHIIYDMRDLYPFAGLERDSVEKT